MSFDQVKEYEVQRGDTLTSVAFAHNLSSKLLRVANPYVSDVLIEKDILLLPFGAKPNQSQQNDKQPSEEQGFVFIGQEQSSSQSMKELGFKEDGRLYWCDEQKVDAQLQDSNDD